MTEKTLAMLSRYRALDLTEVRSWLCGRILADLGADVLKIEPPGGDPGRRIGPFLGDEPSPERSLTWFAHNLGKRGITLDLEKPEGRDIFRKLVRNSDFVIESCRPGYLQGLGLDLDALREINPGIILVSITPYGQSGPYAQYTGSDLVAMAMGGFMFVTGDPDRAPLRISYPLAYPLACAQAAAGALMALYGRQTGGAGQQVDVSVQECITNTLTNVLPTWELNQIVTRRVGPLFFRGGIGQGAHQRVVWQCKDGAVAFMAMGGQAGARSNQALVRWMDDEGMANDFLRGINWSRFDTVTLGKEFHARVEESFEIFFKAHTKEELLGGAQKRGIFLQLVTTPGDILENPQLQARQFWAQVPHPELGQDLKYPGAFVKASGTPLRLSSRAPLIGEHNTPVYEDELGFSREEMGLLRQKGII
jgi:crotonobetainyl-CoA:carnitine CoA-transferase CaiB-like acyl-CoA transferase